MTREREIRVRLEKLATPGPWYFRQNNGSLILDKDGIIVDEPLHAMDAIFIANAPSDIDYLLKENQRLRGAFEWIATLLEHREYADADMLDQIDHKVSQALEGAQ